ERPGTENRAYNNTDTGEIRGHSRQPGQSKRTTPGNSKTPHRPEPQIPDGESAVDADHFPEHSSPRMDRPRNHHQTESRSETEWSLRTRPRRDKKYTSRRDTGEDSQNRKTQHRIHRQAAERRNNDS